MIVRLAAVAANAVASASIARCDIGFDADDRLETCLLGFFLELPRPVKVTVIGYREGWLFELERSADEIVNPVCTVEKGVFGVAVEVDEGHMIRICDADSWR
jgi:hypothetical protein